MKSCSLTFDTTHHPDGLKLVTHFSFSFTLFLFFFPHTLSLFAPGAFCAPPALKWLLTFRAQGKNWICEV